MGKDEEVDKQLYKEANQKTTLVLTRSLDDVEEIEILKWYKEGHI